MQNDFQTLAVPESVRSKRCRRKTVDMFYDKKVEEFKEEGIQYTIRQIDEYRAMGCKLEPSVCSEQVERMYPGITTSPDFALSFKKKTIDRFRR